MLGDLAQFNKDIIAGSTDLRDFACLQVAYPLSSKVPLQMLKSNQMLKVWHEILLSLEMRASVFPFETAQKVIDITMMVCKPTSILHVYRIWDCRDLLQNCLQRVICGEAVERKESIGREHREA